MDAYVNASGVTCNWRENSFYTTTFSFSLPFSALTKLYSFYIETFLPPNLPDYFLTVYTDLFLSLSSLFSDFKSTLFIRLKFILFL